jgi:hypothetical protein
MFGIKIECEFFMMKVFNIIFIFLVSFFIHAQDLTGVWVNEKLPTIDFYGELHLVHTKKDEKVKGYTFDIQENGYCKHTFLGSYIKTQKLLEGKNLEVIDKTENHEASIYNLTYQKRGNTEFLIGTLRTYTKIQVQDQLGQIFSEEVLGDPINVTYKRKSTVPEMKKINDPISPQSFGYDDGYEDLLEHDHHQHEENIKKQPEIKTEKIVKNKSTNKPKTEQKVEQKKIEEIAKVETKPTENKIKTGRKNPNLIFGQPKEEAKSVEVPKEIVKVEKPKEEIKPIEVPKEIVKVEKPKEEVKPIEVPKEIVKVEKPKVIKENPKIISEKRSNRKDVLVNVYNVRSKKIKLDIHDFGKEDGDLISMFYNDKLILHQIEIKKESYVYELQLDENAKSHKLVFVAHNLGTIAPNTGELKLEIDGTTYYQKLATDESKNALIELRVQ